VPFAIAWIVWRERERWLNLSVQPGMWGFTVLAVAACLQIASVLGAGLFAGSLAFLLSLVGLGLCLYGFAWPRVWAFPLLLTLFMLPKLAIVYNQVTLPLQLVATRLAGGMLSTAGFAVVRDGNILNVAGHSIAVVEACNGIRYLLPLASLALVFAYAADAKSWLRVAMLAAAIPTAIIANALRVAFSGLWPALTSGVPHALFRDVHLCLVFGINRWYLPFTRASVGSDARIMIRMIIRQAGVNSLLLLAVFAQTQVGAGQAPGITGHAAAPCRRSHRGRTVFGRNDC
jgi:exosortase